MTMRFLPNQRVSSTVDLIWRWLSFMRTASPGGPGWTIPLASDGTTYGNGSVLTSSASINVYNSPTGRSWFVLRAPSGKPDYLFFKVDGTAGRYTVYVSSTGAFTGGGVFNIPTAPDNAYIHDDSPSATNDCVTHIGADDAAPYGWYVFTHTYGSFTTPRYSMAHIPMNVTYPSGDPNPWVFYYDGSGQGYTRYGICSEDYSSWENHCYAANPGSGSVAFCTAMYLRNENGDFIPNNVELLPSGEDASFPITFGRRLALGAGYFKGVSSFMQWNGRNRSIGETFETKTRIVIGVVNVPWDGVSAMLLS